MPRLPYAGALLIVAALWSVRTSAQSSAPATAHSSTRVQHVVVRGTDAAMEVEIQTSGSPVAPDTQAITGPDRIVVDFPGALPDAELRALKVNRGALKGVRSGLFFSNPPITRIVLDLAEPQSYQISTNQNTVVVKLSPVDRVRQSRIRLPPLLPRLLMCRLRLRRNFRMPRWHRARFLLARLLQPREGPLPCPLR